MNFVKLLKLINKISKGILKAFLKIILKNLKNYLKCIFLNKIKILHSFMINVIILFQNIINKMKMDMNKISIISAIDFCLYIINIYHKMNKLENYCFNIHFKILLNPFMKNNCN